MITGLNMFKWWYPYFSGSHLCKSSIFFASGADDNLEVRITAEGVDRGAKQHLDKFLARGVTEAVLVRLPRQELMNSACEKTCQNYSWT